MIEFCGRIGVKDDLIAVPVALGDVGNVQNANCVTTTLDLERKKKDFHGAHQFVLCIVSDYYGNRTIFICLSGVNPRVKLESSFHPSRYSMRRPNKIVPSGSVNCQKTVSR